MALAYLIPSFPCDLLGTADDPLPETPRYIIEKGRNAEAAEILASLEGGDATIDDPEVVFQRRQIETSLEIESAADRSDLSSCFREARSRISGGCVCVVLLIWCSNLRKSTPFISLSFLSSLCSFSHILTPSTCQLL